MSLEDESKSEHMMSLNEPHTRPEILLAMLSLEKNESEVLQLFSEKVSKPVISCSKKVKIPQEEMPIFDLFNEIPNIIKARQDLIDSLSDNCSEDNINGPTGPWIQLIPKILHVYLLQFHHYYRYLEPLTKLCSRFPELETTIKKAEEDFGQEIQPYLSKVVKYPNGLSLRLTVLVNFIQNLANKQSEAYKESQEKIKDAKTEEEKKKITQATTKIKNVLDVYNTDLRNVTKQLDATKAALQRCMAALQDGYPNELKGTTLTPARKSSHYGTWVTMTSSQNNEVEMVKVISKISVHSQENALQIAREIEANHRLRNPHILRMKEYFQDELFHYIVFPDFQGHELTDLLRKLGSIPEEAARPIFRELIMGVQHMHANGVIHCQLQPSCIVFWNDKLRIYDFSKCELASRGDKTSKESGPLVYSAPETLQSKPFDGSKNDIWSCGIILFECLTGKPPFKSNLHNHEHLVETVKRGNITYPKVFSPVMVSLMHGILNPLPEERYTSEQILAHQWMMKTLEISIHNTLTMPPPQQPKIKKNTLHPVSTLQKTIDSKKPNNSPKSKLSHSSNHPK